MFFGDSLSDTGNNHWVYASQKPKGEYNSAPFTNPDENGQALLWDTVATSLLFPGKKLYPSETRELNPNLDNISYAWATAESGDRFGNSAKKDTPYSSKNCRRPGPIDSSNTEICVPGVIKQIGYYLEDMNHIHENPNHNTLFVIWAGANDITHDIKKLYPISPFYDSYKEGIRAILASDNEYDKSYSFPMLNLIKAIQLLEDSGVLPQQIYIFDLPDLSKTPAVRKYNSLIMDIMDGLDWLPFLPFQDKANVPINIRWAAQTYNNSLNSISLPPNHIFHAAAVFEKIISHQYSGFDNIEGMCRNLESCKGFVFYDEIHPTAAVGKILGQEFVNHLKNTTL